VERKNQTLPTILEMNRLLVRGAVQSGGTVVDATAGNGHDTVFLADLVGEGGQVYAFDIQETALRTTRDRLEKEGFQDRTTLIHDSHSHMATHVPIVVHGQVQAVLFNLGYLPRGDKSLTTQPETTLAGLEVGLDLLAPGGIISLVLYVGHPGGQDEAEAVIRWSQALDPRQYHTFRYELINHPTHPPFLILIEKRR
jgi:predicted methyltransferase